MQALVAASAAILVTLVAGCRHCDDDPFPIDPGHEGAAFNLDWPHREGDLLVFPRSNDLSPASLSRWNALFEALGVEEVESFFEVPMFRIHFEVPRDLASVGRELLQSPLVGSVEANSVVWYRQQPVGVDPKREAQWALDTLGVDEAWKRTRGSEKVIVAVVDSGYERDNPDLARNLWTNPCEDVDPDPSGNDLNGVDDACPGAQGNGYVDDLHGWNFYGRNRELADRSGHGTMVAGIIGAEPGNARLVAGINERVSLMHLKTTDTVTGTLDAVLAAVPYAVANGARLVNASWNTAPSWKLREAIEAAGKKGVVVVAAAGDDGIDLDGTISRYPCAFDLPNLACVTSSDESDHLAAGANHGATRVLVAAPGVGIVTTFGTGWGSQSGTSLATAQVTGIAALVLSCTSPTPEQLVGILAEGDPLLEAAPRTRKQARASAERAVEACPPLLAPTPPELL